MGSYSQGPIHRAQGYLSALIEWNVLSQNEADQRYQAVRQRCNGRGRPYLLPWPKFLDGGNPPDLDENAKRKKLLERLSAGDTAVYCRGYLYALDEHGIINAQFADHVMRQISQTTRQGARWVAMYPFEQSHPLEPYSKLRLPRTTRVKI